MTKDKGRQKVMYKRQDNHNHKTTAITITRHDKRQSRDKAKNKFTITTQSQGKTIAKHQDKRQSIDTR